MKGLFLEELNKLKNESRAIGHKVADDARFMDEFVRFYNANKLAYVLENGHVIEIIMCWILGMIQAGLEKEGVRFDIEASAKLDAKKIDVKVNRARIQLKYAWSDAKIREFQDELRYRNIHVIGIKKFGVDPDYDIIDSLIKIFELAGLSKNQIKRTIDDNPGIDAAEELWVWYTAH